ncbi:hypothetical protein ACJMK2_025706 [Sinanodonta woodiana]|uniref:Uncharacterized protein n=1 Tax=Sinanodonta woodiana TaxID=1069815 RepID=A0ABD3XHV0_SINWO
MPNRAKYLSSADVKKIISLRGKESPTKIVKQFKIGLARLYKIWTDASLDKKFPGGFAGTVSGKHLTENITKINQEIKTYRAEYEKLTKQLNGYRAEIKKNADLVTSDQKILSSLWGKVLQYRKRKKEINEILDGYNKEEAEYNNAIKNTDELHARILQVQEQIKKQNTIIQQLQETVSNNNETINSLKKIKKNSILDLIKNDLYENSSNLNSTENEINLDTIKEDDKTKFDLNWDPQFPDFI